MCVCVAQICALEGGAVQIKDHVVCSGAGVSKLLLGVREVLGCFHPSVVVRKKILFRGRLKPLVLNR